MKRTTMLRNLTFVLSLCVVMCAAAGARAAEEEKFEPGTGKYLLVLIDPHTEVADKKTGKKAKEPNVAKHGGKVLSKNDRMRVIKLPVAAAKALRKEENVAYMQRIWLGESLENWDPQDTAPASVADTELESLEEDLTWSTGQFLYDGRGNIKKVGNDTYSYDSAGRLIKSVVNSTTETYQYDSFGNLTEKKIGSGTPTAVPVDSSSNRLVGETYDAAGNATTQNGAERFSYDSLNMMDELEVSFGSTRRMLYGPDEERIGIIHDENLIRWTLRDFDGRVLREFRGDCCVWEWMEDYVYGEGRLLAGQRMDFFRGKRHFHTDHLGTIRLITDQNTRSISRHDFFPFGIEQTDPHQERKASPMADDYRARTDPMKYTAHEREFLGWYNTENTDYLDFMHARTYDPNRGRFLSVDPVLGDAGRPQTWNRYGYVAGNPVNATDPTGMQAMTVWGKGTGEDICDDPSRVNYDSAWDTFRQGLSELLLPKLEMRYLSQLGGPQGVGTLRRIDSAARLVNRRSASIPGWMVAANMFSKYRQSRGKDTFVYENVIWTKIVGARAITYGNVIIVDSTAANDPRVMAHEDVHVTQYERQGLLFYWDYLTQSSNLYLLTGDGYNLIEQEIEANR